MNKRFHLIINFVAFQVAWFACVLTAANNQPIFGLVTAVVVVGIHLSLVENRLRALIALAIVTVIGVTWDSILTSTRILIFDTGLIVTHLAPYWIIAMWLSFATTLSVSLRWLYGRYVLALILGAIAGPLAYQAGHALGAVSIPNSFIANIVIAVGWAVLMPLFMAITEAIENTTAKEVTANDL